MNYRSIAIAAILTCLFGLGASMVSCNDSGGDDNPRTEAAQAGNQRGAAATPAADEQPPADTAQTAGGEPAPAGEPEEPAEPASSAFMTGDGVYKAANCEMCHGKQLQGTNLAPELKALAANWDAESLTAYLLDPEGYTEGDVRLKANSVQYKLPMPAWKQTGLGEPDLDLLVKWLLEQE